METCKVGDPSVIIGASTGQIGTAVMQAGLRSVPAFCNSPHLNALEAAIRFSPPGHLGWVQP